MNRDIRHCIFLSILAILIAAPTALTQSSMLLIQTYDDAGNPLPSVNIHLDMFNDGFLMGQEAVRLHSKTSDGVGEMRFFQLKPGAYRVTAGRNGFKGLQSDRFNIEQRSIIFCRIYLVPELKDLISARECKVRFHFRTFPVISWGRILTDKYFPSSTIAEQMESLPGILVHPETGIPRFPSQRTTDVALFIDGIPVQDPSDQRPGFFPPASLIAQVLPVRAGQDVDQQTAAGGAVYLRTRHASGRKLSGMLGFSDIISNSSFIRDASSKKMFNYWHVESGRLTDIPEQTPDLIDRRSNLLLSGSLLGADMTAAIDWRRSNRGYTSDVINSDALEDVNAWSRLSFVSKGSWNIITGYQQSDHLISNLWKLRGFPAIESEQDNLLMGIQYRQRIFSTYWYAVTASGLSLSTQGQSHLETFPGNYPYDLGDWFSSNRRSAVRCSMKVGNTTRYHDIEAGMGVNRLDIDVNEGFFNTLEQDPSRQVVYEWNADICDWEFAMWGHDRWFLSENLELGFSLRWDRFNYLTQTDYLSPRLYFEWDWGKNRLTGGVERIAQSPGISFISDQVRFPVQSDQLLPVTQPQLGFRWYGGYHRDIGRQLNLDLNGFYSLLSQMIFMLPIQTKPGIELSYPATGHAGKIMGICFRASWFNPEQTVNLNLAYGYSRARVSWGDDIILAHIRPYAELPWPREYYSGTISSQMPMDNDLTHSIRLNAWTLIPVVDIDIGFDYRITSGRTYTEVAENGDPMGTGSASGINGKHGDIVQRLDIEVSKRFDVSRSFILQCRLKMINITDAYQFPTIDPHNGESVVDPYRLDSNQPRTLTAGLFLYF
ncbi:TonB-dependent receptor [bacterium]|nr:TonB-dependent receptor [candidate division CSSED10-310 bacterium]